MSKRPRSKESSQETPAAAKRAASTAILATAMMTGAAVMMLELLGTRVIGPFYGVSMFVWSSLISVTLISLAVGYFVGGRLADRGRIDLSLILVVAGFATALIPVLRAPILALTNSLGLRAGAFCSALLLFFAPLTVLAMVGPYVVKTLATQPEKVGSVSGAVMAAYVAVGHVEIRHLLRETSKRTALGAIRGGERPGGELVDDETGEPVRLGNVVQAVRRAHFVLSPCSGYPDRANSRPRLLRTGR